MFTPASQRTLGILHPSDRNALFDHITSALNGGNLPGVSGNRADGSHGAHTVRANRSGYARLPASTTQAIAVVGGFTSTFTLQQSMEDCMLYLNDDADMVSDITSLVIGAKTLTLAGALPASTLRDAPSLGGPVKGYYVGDVASTQIITIVGNTKVAAAIFGFYLLGRMAGGDGVDIVAIAGARTPNPSSV